MADEKKGDESSKEQARSEEGREPTGATEAKQGEASPGSEEPSSAEPEKELSFDDLASRPEAKFTVLVSSIATQVFVSLGLLENPLSKKKEADLQGAKFSIDLLQLLADKTRGNLTAIEKRYLEGVLHELRMRYVEASK